MNPNFRNEIWGRTKLRGKIETGCEQIEIVKIFIKSATKVIFMSKTTSKLNNLIKIYKLLSIENAIQATISYKTINKKKVYRESLPLQLYNNRSLVACKSLKILFKSTNLSLNLRNFHIPMVYFNQWMFIDCTPNKLITKSNVNLIKSLKFCFYENRISDKVVMADEFDFLFLLMEKWNVGIEIQKLHDMELSGNYLKKLFLYLVVYYIRPTIDISGFLGKYIIFR